MRPAPEENLSLSSPSPKIRELRVIPPRSSRAWLNLRLEPAINAEHKQGAVF